MKGKRAALPTVERNGHARCAFWRRNGVPFLLGVVIAPVFVLLHEGGHFLAGAALGFHPDLHYANVSYRISRPPPPRADVLITASGPALQALLVAAGLLWLRRRRRGRRARGATCLDWVATWLVLNSCRWVAGGIASPFTATALKDEVRLSAALGLPAWFLLSLLGLLSLGALILMVRLHPPRSRLVPFACAAAGGLLAAILWMRFLGPWLLP